MHTGLDGFIHPVAGAAFFATFKIDTLQAETLADQGIEVDAGGQHVAAEPRRVESGAIEVVADAFIHRPIKKSDLAFVVFLMVEVAVADEASAGDALNSVDFFDTVIEAAFAVTTDKVVPSGNVDCVYLHVIKINFKKGEYVLWP